MVIKILSILLWVMTFAWALVYAADIFVLHPSLAQSTADVGVFLASGAIATIVDMKRKR